jgi:hypothetical protein
MKQSVLNRMAMGAALAAVVGVGVLDRASAEEAKGVPLKLELPRPMFVGTPPPGQEIPNLEPQRGGPRPPMMVPEGTVNLAIKKTVTSSEEEPLLGFLDMVTDGDKSAEEGSYVELFSGKQWVQIDLGATSPVYAIALWHFHSQPRVYHDVVVQISDDPEFVKDVQTVFNNDHDNSLGLGAGKDMAYVETNEGKLIAVKGVKGRYVRLYSNGNTTNAMNHYIEVEVYGLPPKP